MDQTDKQTTYQRLFKRALDCITALTALVLLSPLIAGVALLVRLRLGAPVIFRQERPGLNEEIFTLYKFRTMRDLRDGSGQLLPDEERITRLGELMRALSLDELPQLINVLKGDMSMIGPRPQLVRDMVFMTPAQRKRHEVMPGITGWAQVNGRNSISWDDKLALDLEYLPHITFLGDAGILLRTLGKVFQREEAGAEETRLTEDFGQYLLQESRVTPAEFEEKMKEAVRLLDEYRSGGV